jgi:ABC-type antimicrobial peptide transport system permease subunit
MGLDLPEPSFPLSEVILLSFSNIRRRFFRSIITALGIILGIAFMTSLIMNSIIIGLLEEGATVEAYQWWLVGISLVVAFGGITNSMLMAVNERIKEIGVYKCIGGLDKHIIRLFLVEALLLGILGGSLGAIIGIGTGTLVNYAQNPEAVGAIISSNVSLVTILFIFSLIVSILLTVLATYIPANRAAKLTPADALRYEN